MKKAFLAFPVRLLVLWLLALAYHCGIIRLSPLPWFDETYFASMASHFAESGDFFAPVCPLMDYYYPQSLAYGPGYFVMLAGFFKLFGFGMVQMRLPGLIFGFVFLLLGYKILKESGVSGKFIWLFFILLLLDPIYLQNIHSARMDSMALLFSGFGTLYILRGVEKHHWWNYLFGGAFLGLALLCTPRIAVNIVGPGFAAAIMFFRNNLNLRAGARLLLIPLMVIALYSVWVFWGFGGFSEALNYFFGQPREKLYYDNLAQGYISFRKYIPVFQYPAIILVVVFIFLWLIRRLKFNYIQMVCLMNLMAYFVLVRDTGIYSIFSMPWIYLLLVSFTDGLIQSGKASKPIILSLLILVFINAGLFFIKQSVIILSAASRNDEEASQAISKLIPKGSRVIGDEVYYYAALKNGLKFQYLDRGAAGHQRLSYHKINFNFEYVIVRNPVINPEEFNFYRKNIPLKKVGEISSHVPSFPYYETYIRYLAKLGISIPAGYRGTIYRR